MCFAPFLVIAMSVSEEAIQTKDWGDPLALQGQKANERICWIAALAPRRPLPWEGM